MHTCEWPSSCAARKLVEMGALDSPEDVVYFKYNEFRVFMGNPSGMDGRALVAERKAAQDKAYTFRPKSWIGNLHAHPAGLPLPEPVGLPRQVLPQGFDGQGPDQRPRRLARRRRRHR